MHVLYILTLDNITFIIKHSFVGPNFVFEDTLECGLQIFLISKVPISGLSDTPKYVTTEHLFPNANVDQNM